MDVAQVLQQAGVLDTISRELGVDAATAQAGATALLPAILGGFKKQAQTQPGGLGGLADILGGLGGGGLLESVLSPGATPVQQGNDVLGQIFGSKEVSREVAGGASASTGLDAGLLKKMLPIIAMAMAGYMAHQSGAGGQNAGGQGGGGMLGQVLGSVLGGGQSSTGAAGGLGGGLGGLASMLDLDGDGNPLDDLINIAGKMRG